MTNETCGRAVTNETWRKAAHIAICHHCRVMLTNHYRQRVNRAVALSRRR